MIRLIILQLKKRMPIISILLIISCLISTLPQFILSDVYSDITGQVVTNKNLYLLTLSAFTHAPDILVNHLIVNIFVFVIYGIVIEIVIGSKRFALISVITFLSTTIVNNLHTTSKYIVHGASGIAWGYHMFFIYFLIVLFEYKGKQIFKDVYIILGLLLLVFNIIGIPILEVVISKMGFFDNFGQVLHLISMLIVVPFIFLWRGDIESNVIKLISKEQIIKPINFKSIGIIIILFLVLLNAFGTYKVINLTTSREVKVVPESGSNIVDIPKKIIVKFDQEVQDSQRTLTSIYSDESLEKIEIREEWQDSKTLFIEFNRDFIDEEKIRLIYLITSELEDGIVIKDELILEY